MNKKLLHLDNTLLLNKGGVREVYHHPGDPSKCIKITFNLKKRRSVIREIKYLQLYKRRNMSFEHLPSFHGYCITTKGRGEVYDLIKDFDGKVSVTLSEHVSNKITPCLTPSEIRDLLTDLHKHILRYNIIVSDPAPHNLLVNCTSKDQKKLVIIDGIGNPHFVKIADYSTYFAHQIINKKWQKYVVKNLFLERIFANKLSPDRDK